MGSTFRAEASGTRSRTARSATAPLEASCSGATTFDNDVKQNTFTGNRVGILVNGAVDSRVKDNVISGSTLAGIRFGATATGNVVKDNQVTSNLVGVEFLVADDVSATGNELTANLIAANGCGLKGPTGGNAFNENLFQGNAADTCP